MPIDAVLFDLDGTLLHTAPDFETALNQLLQSEGKPLVNEGDMDMFVTDGSAGIIRASFAIDDDSEKFERLRQSLLSNYRACMTEKTGLFPGLQDCLDFLQQRDIPWGIVTNKPQEYANPVVEKLKLNANCIICPDHVSIAKPHPEGIFLACDMLQARSQHTLYIGDHIRDIQAGKAAECLTAAALYGYVAKDENIDDWNADYHLHQPTDLLPLLQSLISY